MKSSKFRGSEATRQQGNKAVTSLPPCLFASLPDRLRTSYFELPTRAFTLVEMMVVVAIIALLLAALLPAFSAVRNQAKIVQVNAQFKALDTGINAFRAEAALGGSLPPSASDKDAAVGRQLIANPLEDAPTTEVRISGAHLLVHAMIGADGLGTPGFRDVGKPDGLWSNDTHKKFDASDPKKCGIYAMDPATGKEKFTRYGGGGYVDEKMKENARTLKELAEKGSILTDVVAISPKIAYDQRVFTDPWDHPILYYKANPSALRMTGASGSPPKPGIYWQEDNAIITGTEGGVLPEDRGLDFGASTDEHGQHHWIHNAKSPEPSEKVEEVASLQDDYIHTFARFIIDGSVKARPTPVQKDTYLLISAGPDAIYGSDDDIINWTRKTD